MSINLLPHKISIKGKTTTNVGGGGVASYANSAYVNIPSLVKPASGQMIWVYQQRNLAITHEIYTNKPVAAKTGDIVIFGTRQFFIQACLNILESSRLFRIVARELTDNELIVEA